MSSLVNSSLHRWMSGFSTFGAKIHTYATKYFPKSRISHRKQNAIFRVHHMWIRLELQSHVAIWTPLVPCLHPWANGHAKHEQQQLLWEEEDLLRWEMHTVLQTWMSHMIKPVWSPWLWRDPAWLLTSHTCTLCLILPIAKEGLGSYNTHFCRSPRERGSSWASVDKSHSQPAQKWPWKGMI